ncbi:MAG TPA: hypothetical protein VLZ74_01250 [Methylocella sp.]|nr:hypothetical protein [Methylocella sp.]
MDVMNFLKTVPAVFGVAGLLTYFMRPRELVSDHEVVQLLQGARAVFVLLACAALIGLSLWLFFGPSPPTHDVALLEQRGLLPPGASFLMIMPHPARRA